LKDQIELFFYKPKLSSKSALGFRWIIVRFSTSRRSSPSAVEWRS